MKPIPSDMRFWVKNMKKTSEIIEIGKPKHIAPYNQISRYRI